MKYRIAILLVTLSHYYTSAQTTERPKLVVGIVVDQMRAEYLYRFQENYSENGFKRLMREGFNVKNMHYNYTPTATGPGHASIFTGTTPAHHGIVANNWYSREKQKPIYCAEDTTAFLVDITGQRTEITSYSRSPKNLMANTITDELKLFSNNRSKVTGISLKDRGAIFPAGHLADYAFWYNNETGNFITSSYYTKTLPKWLKDFNERQLSDSLLNLNWDTFLPIKKYRNSGLDAVGMEKLFIGKNTASFPYNLKKIRKENGEYSLMPQVPFGNSLLTQMAMATIEGEHMGQDQETDFLTISYSSTDYVGHGFGIRSKEIEDTYVRMDRELSELLSFLDLKVGNGNYLLFLTADHAASDHPVFLEESRLKGKFFETPSIKELLEVKLSKMYGTEDYIAYIDKTQIYFNPVKTPKEAIVKATVSILSKLDGLNELFNPKLHEARNIEVDAFFRKSYNYKNSGDVLLNFEPGWIPLRNEGTTHGSIYNNDTHVPMLWYGWKVKNGQSVKKKSIEQIAPTLSFLLNIPLANLSSDIPIAELFEQ